MFIKSYINLLIRKSFIIKLLLNLIKTLLYLTIKIILFLTLFNYLLINVYIIIFSLI